jgi:hypothetical protein
MIKETDGAKQATLIQSQSSLIGSLEIPAAVVTPRWPTIHCAILEVSGCYSPLASLAPIHE